MLPFLSGFVCAFHSAAQGSSPKHTIYVFIIYSQKGRFGPYFRDFLQLRQTYQTRTFYFQVDRLQPKPISWQWSTLLGYVANSLLWYAGPVYLWLVFSIQSTNHGQWAIFFFQMSMGVVTLSEILSYGLLLLTKNYWNTFCCSSSLDVLLGFCGFSVRFCARDNDFKMRGRRLATDDDDDEFNVTRLGDFLKVLGNKFSCKSSPNIWWQLGYY